MADWGGSPTVTVLLGNGDGTSNALSANIPVQYAGLFLVADFNGDGIPDLAVEGGLSEQSLTVLLGNGDGTFTAVSTSPVISLPAGSYPTAQTVTISDATPGTVIYYTMNGSWPSTSTPSIYGSGGRRIRQPLHCRKRQSQNS